MSAAPPAGSIEAAAARLALWASSPGEGFIRATFSDPLARDSVLRSLRSQLPEGIPLHIVTVPPGNAEESARYIFAELQRLGPGLVSIHEIGAGLPPTDESATRVLHAFNAFRERFRVHGQQSIWWLPDHIAKAFSHGQRDFASWFLKRFDLSETVRKVGTLRKGATRPEVSRHIPEDVSREVLARAGHKCSACGEPCPRELAHIVPISAAHDYFRAENLVCLCANCHSRADDPTTGWDVPTLQRYRDDPWVNRSRRMGDPISLPVHIPKNLPYLSLGTLFKGRETFLADLRKSLSAQNPAVIRGAQAIHGMGGVGKTRAAVEYAWAHEQDYNALLFVTADSPDSLQQNLAALCGPLVLNLPEQDATDIRSQLHAVLQWLQQHPGWLLILDNVDTPEAQRAVRALLPQLPDGHVLITSRMADWPAGVTSLDLDVISEESSIQFLLERTQDRRIRRDDDHQMAQTIARQLDGLIISLEHCAAYIRRRRCSFADFLREWDERRHDILRWHDSATHHYPRSVAVTYATSVAQVSPDARELLHILSWLAPDPMPVQHLESLRGFADPRLLLVELLDLHLATLSVDGTTFSVHRLLQEITRQQQTEDKPTGLVNALSWVNAAMPEETNDVRSWPVAVPLLPHALAIATYAAARDIPTPTTRLLDRSATLVQYRGNYSAAEPHFRRALALAEKHLGPNHPEAAIYLSNLATLLLDTNRVAEAEPLMRRALAIAASSYGEDHPLVAASLNNLAMLLHSTNRLVEAEALMRRALAIDEAYSGRDHPLVALRISNLAILLKDSNRLAEAEPLLRKAMAIDESSFGKDHPNVARDLNNLADLLKLTNRLEEAEPLMRRVVSIFETALGNDHPKVGSALCNLAELLRTTGIFEESESLLRRGMKILEASLGQSHPSYAVALNNLALLLKDTDRREEAEPMMARALRIFEDSLGSEHPNSVMVRENLAIFRKEMGLGGGA